MGVAFQGTENGEGGSSPVATHFHCACGEGDYLQPDAVGRTRFAHGVRGFPGPHRARDLGTRWCWSSADMMVTVRIGLSTPCGRLAQLVRAPALQAGSRGFESLTAHHFWCPFNVG